MIHILIAGNMNHRSIDLIFYLVKESDGEDQGHWLLDVLHKTHIDRNTLSTACSMLVDCYLKGNMMNMALQLTCQMKNYNCFPS